MFSTVAAIEAVVVDLLGGISGGAMPQGLLVLNAWVLFLHVRFPCCVLTIQRLILNAFYLRPKQDVRSQTVIYIQLG